MDKNEENKKIEIVSGNGDDLDISPVYTHLPMCKPDKEKEKEKKNIVIPEEKAEND